jgi:hypothetical protein
VPFVYFVRHRKTKSRPTEVRDSETGRINFAAALGQSRKYVLRNRNITGIERNTGVLQKAKPSLREVMPDYCVVLSSLGSKKLLPSVLPTE